jgi:hypothetical protein
VAVNATSISIVEKIFTAAMQGLVIATTEAEEERRRTAPFRRS